MPQRPPTARLLIACPDARGITAAVTGFIAEHGGNLLDLDQHTDAEHGEFFLRAEFEPAPGDSDHAGIDSAFQELAQQYGMTWRSAWSHDPRRIAILVGRQAHCLLDLLWRRDAGEIPGEIVAIISNHDDLAGIAQAANIPFHHVPIEGEDTCEQEARVEKVIDEASVDLVVLARYMRVLSEDFVNPRSERIINVHHSFLPAFPGGDPYRQAYERGVKVIGATAHYVTPVLDDGPIITQSVGEVSHHDSLDDLRRRGRDLERTVLSNAVKAHLEDRILVRKNRTIVFR